MSNRRLLLSPFWFLVALATVIGTNATSAAAGSAAETRVRAFEHVTVDSVGQQSSERPASVGFVRPETAAIASGSCVATKVGGGSGPWVDDALSTPVPGMTRPQSLPGSCVSACGEVLTGAGRTEAQLLDALGEWSNPGALADELGAGWQGGGFGSGADALAAARRGPMGAVLQAPGGPGHMVVTTPLGGGRFQVLDPFDGTGYIVDSGWIERYVSGGVFQ